MAAKHGTPVEDMCCLVTMEDITMENYVEYQVSSSSSADERTTTWHACLLEESVVRQLRDTQFHNYIERVKKTDCQAELRRLLAAGPPIHVADPHGFPEASDDDRHVSALWFASTSQEEPSVLDGAVQGKEREDLWQDLRKFIIVEGKEEGDDDEGDKATATTADNS